MEESEKGRFKVEWLEVDPVVLPVLGENSSIVELISVLLGDLDFGETCGLFDDGSVQDGIVESGVMFGRVVVFLCKCFWMCGSRGENNSDEFVVVLVMVPVPEGKFTLARDVKEELSEFGGSAVFSDDHAILG